MISIWAVWYGREFKLPSARSDGEEWQGVIASLTLNETLRVGARRRAEGAGYKHLSHCVLGEVWAKLSNQ